MIRGGKVGDDVYLHAYTAGPRKATIVHREKRVRWVWYMVGMVDENGDVNFLTVRAGWLTRRKDQLT